MISHAHRCIFIHQRKCAGSSIKQAFGFKYHDEDRNYATDGVLSPEFAERPRDYLVFAVARNPWDRFISGWRYCRSTQNRSLIDVLENPPLEGHDYRHLTRPQHAVLFDDAGQAVFDVLLRYESLQPDFDALCDRLKMPRVRLPVVNKKAHAHYSQYFDDESRALFEQAYADDIKRFGYSFEPKSPGLLDRLRSLLHR